MFHRLLKQLTGRQFVQRIASLFVVGTLMMSFADQAFAATYTSGSLALSNPTISASSTTYTITVGGVTTSAIQCIQVRFTGTIGSNAKPTGMNVTSAAFSGSSTYVPTPASWTPTNDNTNGIVQLTFGSGETPASASNRKIILTGITNGSTPATTYYAEISTFNNTDCSTSPVDSGTVAFIYDQGVTATATVNPSLTFTVSSTSCGLGTLSTSATGSCSHTVIAGTNAVSGYTISYLPTTTLTNGGATIDAIGGTATTSTTGAEQFGINLKDNATPNVGVNPSGGSGAPLTNYNVADNFAFNTAGANIASAAGTSANTTFTVSYIANIASNTDAGNYSTTVTYNIVANY